MKVAEQILAIAERAERAIRSADIPGIRKVSVSPHDGDANTADPGGILAALRGGDLTVRVDCHYWRGQATDLEGEHDALLGVPGVVDVDWDGDGSDESGPIESGALTIEGIRDSGNYRVYDHTGGQVTEDIEAESDSDATEQGRDWIEDGEWSEPWDGDEDLYETIDLPCEVAPHIYRIEVDGSSLDEDAMRDEAMDCSGRYEREQPECEAADDGEHDWQAPYHLVGGCRENPGVWSTGGTSFTVTEVCARCGIYRTTHIPGSQRNPDEPLESVRFSPADEDSERWVKSLREEEVTG